MKLDILKSALSLLMLIALTLTAEVPTSDNKRIALPIENMGYYPYEQFYFEDIDDDEYRIDIGGDLIVNNGKPVQTYDEIKTIATEVYSILLGAAVPSIVNGKCSYLIVIHSLDDNLLYYCFTRDENTFGGSIGVLIDGDSGQIIGCWPGE